MSLIEVLTKKGDFQRIHSEGRALRGPDVVVVCARTERATGRYAVVASRKVGSAVRRNRAKRILREALRQVVHGVDLVGIDILLIARASAVLQSSRGLREQLGALLLREGLLPEESRTQPEENRNSS